MGKGWTVRNRRVHKGASIQDSGVRIQNGQPQDGFVPAPSSRPVNARAYRAAGNRADIEFSTVWKTGVEFFHSVEKMGSIFT